MRKFKGEEMTFTLEELVRAWKDFTKPLYLVNQNLDVDENYLKDLSKVISNDPSDLKMETIGPDYQQFIPFLINWKYEKMKGKCAKNA